MALQRHLRIVDGNPGEAPAGAVVKVAFATADRIHVDQHFGSACSFVIYAVGPAQAALVEIAQFGDLPQDGHEDKLPAKLALLEGCAAVYCQAVGGSAIRQLLSRGIQPLRVAEGALIERVLQELTAALPAQPPPWLAKALQRQAGTDTDRFAVMEAEGWPE